MMTTTMTNDEIIALAREECNSYDEHTNDYAFNLRDLVRFATRIEDATKAQPKNKPVAGIRWVKGLENISSEYFEYGWGDGKRLPVGTELYTHQPIASQDLLAAAPDLLEAIQELFDIGQPFVTAIEAKDSLTVDFEKWAEKARAAIAKAKGEMK